MADEPAFEDHEYDPSIEPESSKVWLNLITDAERAFDEYQNKADNIDKLFANLNRLAKDNRDREFQMFWANIQVIGPSIYSRPPIPVVVPRFKERRPIPKAASELLERATSVMFELEDIDGTMRMLRDDLTIVARGVPWCRYETKEESGSSTEKVCIEHLDRKDFLHDPARKWKEVDWTARRAWMTRKDMRKRFSKTSGKAYQDATYTRRKDDKDLGVSSPGQKCAVWELWSKSQNKVVWVSEGVEKCLDSGKPHLKLQDFFPCPRPAYSTVQRRSLVPVPDMVMYKDQLEEINELTGRIGALSQAIKVRGFYPAGAGEIADAVEMAMKSLDDRQILIGVSNWAAFGQGGDPIIWLPIDMVAKTIVQLVELRKQLIDDVYQITGLSDIMRGSTKANETLGAQELKSQYGSIRIRDRQDELVRVARDLIRIVAEIMAENFSQKTLLDMSQMELPTDAEISRQVKEIEDQAKQLLAAAEQQIKAAQTNPQLMQQAQENPEEAQKLLAQVKQQAEQQLQAMRAEVDKLNETVTIDQVMDLLREQRTRPFVLDVETDSTIAPDENAQKQRATEYVTALSGLLGQAQMVKEIPELAPVFSDVIKFVNSQFRVGREVQTTVDEFAERMKALASQPKGPDPEAMKAQADAQMAQQKGQIEQMKAQADAEKQKAETALKLQEADAKAKNEDLDRRVREQEAIDASKARDADIAAKKAISDMQLSQLQAKGAAEGQKHVQEMEIGVLNIALLKTKIDQARQQTENSIATTEAGVNATAEKTELAAKSKEPA